MDESVKETGVTVPCVDAHTAVLRSWLAVHRMMVDPKHTEAAMAALRESRRVLSELS